MKKTLFNSTTFRLSVLFFIIVATFMGTTFIFSSQIDKLKTQIDNIYFGNFVPVLKLQTIIDSYKDMIMCLEDKKCNSKEDQKKIEKNWEYYFNSYKTLSERVVVDDINKDITQSFSKPDSKFLIKTIKKINFLIDYEIESAYKQRKEFLQKYADMKDYLLYTFIALSLFSFGTILFILVGIFKKDSQLTVLNKQYKLDAITDGMTSLYNRNYFDTVFDNLPFISNENNWKSAFIMVDIDFFKQYNDTYGHDMGDETLKSVAMVLKEYFNKEFEYVFRLGGEEFGVVLFNTNKEMLEHCMKDINEAVVNLQIEHKNSKALDVVSISMGAIIYDAHTHISGNRLYKMADENLYKSKQSGRNKYTI